MSTITFTNPSGVPESVFLSAPDHINLGEINEVIDEVFIADIYDVSAFVEPDDLWLDVGCHVGLFAISVIDKGAAVNVIDSDRESVIHAVGNARIFEMMRKGAMGDPGASSTFGSCAKIASWEDLEHVSGYDGLKMDIQGAEKDVLTREGASMLHYYFKRLVYEYHFDDHAEHQNLMKAAGWHLHRMKRHTDVLLDTPTTIYWWTAHAPD